LILLYPLHLHLHLNLLIQGSTQLKRISAAWTAPSPSHRPTEPPTAERKELRVGFTKSVVVTWTEGENEMPIIEYPDSKVDSETNLVSV
jgi:hypothetical protein